MASFAVNDNGWIAIACSLLLMTGIGFSYSLGVKRKEHVLFPSLSSAASNQPENGIFRICIFPAVLLGFASVAMRYGIVSAVNNTPFNRPIDIINKLTLPLGVILFVGLIVIAAFPFPCSSRNSIKELDGKLPDPHRITSYFLFTSGSLYCILHTIITMYLKHESEIIVCCCRLGISFFIVSTFVIYVGHAAPTNYCMVDENSHYVNPHSLAELFMGTLIAVYIYSLYNEFRMVCIRVTTTNETYKKAATESLPSQEDRL